MRKRPTISDRIAVQETITPRPFHDPLLLTIIGAAIILSGLIFMMYLSWGSGQALGDTPWYIPVTHSFAGLAAFSVAFLAFGRYPALREAASYWIGMGFAALGIQSVFFILAWPGLLPGGQGIIARLPSTSGWIAMFELASLSLSLLAAVLSRWPGWSPGGLPGEKPLPGRRWMWSTAASIGLVILICILLVVYEQYLPVLVGPQGNLTPIILSLDWVFMLLFSAGAYLSARQYQRTGDALLGYVALTQLALTFVVLTAIIGAKRYDIWYYLSRVIIVGGFLSLMFGLLSEYVRLFRREREGRQTLEAILENVPIGLAITGGPPAFPLVRVSRHGLEMNQRPAEGLIGTPTGRHQAVWSIFLPDGITQPLPEQMPLYRASRFGEEIRNMELVMEAQDGRKIPVLVNAAPIRDSSGQLIAAINTWLDITDIKQAEAELLKSSEALKERNEKLRESEERYRGLFETMQEGLVAAEVITDENGNPVDYRYLDVNPATERHFGMSRDQFVGRTYTEVLPTAEPEWIDILGRVALTGEPVSVERYGPVTGLWFQTRAYSPRPGEFVHILTDITERKRAEQALQRSQRVLAQAGRMARLGAWESPISRPDSINDNPLYWSEEVFHLFGYTPGEVEVSNELFFSHVPPEDRPHIEQAIAKAIAEHQVYSIEHRIIRADGSERIVIESAEIQYDDHGKPVRVIGAVQDITERKRAEEALRESEQRYHGLFETMQEALFAVEVITDGHGNPVDWRYMDVNPQVERYMGMSYEQLVGHKYSEVVPHADPAWIALMGRVALTGEPANQEMYAPTHGRWLQVSVYSLRPGQAVGLFSDITERRQAEAALRQSEIRFRQLADAMPQLVWTAHPDGGVDYYNRRYQEYDGIAAEPDGIWQWSPVLHPGDVQPTEAAWKRAVETGEPYQIEHRVQMADGAYRWHLSRALLGLDEQGQATKWFGTATDIHDLKQAGAALHKHAAELERANRDLQNFTVMASHDLQEPLRKIEALGDTVLVSASMLDEHLYDRIQRMRKSAQQMRKMVDGLLQLSLLSTDTQSFQTADLYQITAEILTDKKEQIQQSGGVVEVGELPVIEADAFQMRRLLQHLIENALKFQPPGAKPQIIVSSKQLTSGFVQIHIGDNGIGFDEAHARKLFEPFERLVGKNQPQYEGIGMGLAICRRIVERHGGEIDARSKPGQGTTFIITLPIQLQNNSRNETGKVTNYGNPAAASGR